MSIRLLFISFLCVLALAVISAVTISPPPARADGEQAACIDIVTTTAQIADIIRNITRQDGYVTPLMGEGVDPHLYRPTRSDIVKLRRADMIFYNGLHLEGQMVDLLETMAREKPSVALAEELESSELIAGESTKFDPHVWMDVGAWIKATDVALIHLQKYKPEKAELFGQQAKPYIETLQALDNYARSSYGSIPEETRILITAHDAFGYLGKAYDFEVIGIQGISTESEAGLQRIETLVDMLVTKKVPAVFIETSVTDRNVQALIEGAAARGHRVKIGGELYSDAMGQKGAYTGTYEGMMDHNITVITNALGGSAPVTGMNDRLNEELN